MPIPAEIRELINRLNQELSQTEQDGTDALNIVRQRLSIFANNDILIQLFAAASNILFFVEIYRGRIERIIERISPEEVPREVIQEGGEDLGIILGQVLEVKINANRLKNRLENR